MQDVFYIEYRDGMTGGVAHKRVVGAKIARAIARSTAIATGRRVIVRREPPRTTWTVMLWDSQTGQLHTLRTGKSKLYAKKYFARWDVDQTEAVAILWPDSMPIPKRLEV